MERLIGGCPQWLRWKTCKNNLQCTLRLWFPTKPNLLPPLRSHLSTLTLNLETSYPIFPSSSIREQERSKRWSRSSCKHTCRPIELTLIELSARSVVSSYRSHPAIWCQPVAGLRKMHVIDIPKQSPLFHCQLLWGSTEVWPKYGCTHTHILRCQLSVYPALAVFAGWNKQQTCACVHCDSQNGKL